jgi:hypothetical protein
MGPANRVPAKTRLEGAKSFPYNRNRSTAVKLRRAGFGVAVEVGFSARFFVEGDGAGNGVT